MSSTVLVIDNNSAVQAIAALALNETECTVEPLTDGTKALSRIRELHPSVILCARDIPGVNAFALCREVKEISPASAFILLAPAEGMQETQAAAREVLCDDVLFKPFKSNRLRETVIRCFDSTRLVDGGRDASPSPAARIVPREQTSTALATSLPKMWLAVGDTIRGSMLKRVLTRLGFPSALSPGEGELFVTDTVESLPAQPPRWTVFIGESDQLPEAYEGAVLLAVPLSEQSVFATMCGVWPTLSWPAAADAPLTDDQLVRLVSQLSAAVYSQLIELPALRHREWMQVEDLLKRIFRRAAAPLGWKG